MLTTLGRIVFEATHSQQRSIMTNNMSDLDKFLCYGLLRRSKEDSSDLDWFLFDGLIPGLPQGRDWPPPPLIKKTQKEEDSQLRSVVPQPEPEPSSNEHEAFLTDNPATTAAQLLPVTETASEFLEKLVRLQMTVVLKTIVMVMVFQIKMMYVQMKLVMLQTAVVLSFLKN